MFKKPKYYDLKLLPGESYREYKSRVMDVKSSSFCGAKWYYSTVWLGSGMTTSCHHPLPHRVSEEEVIANYKALANTTIRKQERREMQQGIRCAGCDYCWRVEDLNSDQLSDRVYKTVLYDDNILQEAYEGNADQDVDLRYLEISFDRTCNLACSYCNPAFSTTWVKDIKSNGPYKNLITDANDHYGHAHDSAGMYDKDEDNPYVQAFFKWWEADLHKTLSHLRLTGGEPLMSKHTWKLLKWFETHKRDDIYFAINSNLITKPENIEKLILASKNTGDFNIYTSCESIGKQAEYIRDGFDWKIWTQNFDRIAQEDNIRLHSMCTIGAISLDGLIDYLNWCLGQKKKYHRDTPTFTLNIQRFPKFQNPLILPMDIRRYYAIQLDEWLEENAGSHLLHDMEIEHVQRLIDYLDKETNSLGDEEYISSLKKDFKTYYDQYDLRRNKSFVDTFGLIGEWYKTL
jgi:organic radical activating enzyme